MKRLDEFKYLRRYRRKCISVILFFLLLTTAGILVTDYCTNSIVNNEKMVSILKVESGKDSTLQLKILNNVINLHCGSVINDFDNIKKMLFGWIK